MVGVWFVSLLFYLGLLGVVASLQEPVIGRESAGCDHLLHLEAFLRVVTYSLQSTCRAATATHSGSTVGPLSGMMTHM